MERFFLNLKMERVWRRDYANQEEARRDVADYLLTFYNQKRLNSALGNMSPAEFEDNASSNLRLCRLERLTPLSGVFEKRPGQTF